jgi:hypothetical protein
MSEAATAEHDLIGPLQTAPVIRTDGFVDWFCCPRLDSRELSRTQPSSVGGECADEAARSRLHRLGLGARHGSIRRTEGARRVAGLAYANDPTSVGAEWLGSRRVAGEQEWMEERHAALTT